MNIRPRLTIPSVQISQCSRNKVRPNQAEGDSFASSPRKSTKTNIESKGLLTTANNLQSKQANLIQRELGKEGPPSLAELNYFYENVVQGVSSDLETIGFEKFDPKSIKLQTVMQTGTRNGTYWDARAKINDRPYYLVAISCDDFPKGKVFRFEGYVNKRIPSTVTNNPLRMFEALSALSNPTKRMDMNSEVKAKTVQYLYNKFEIPAMKPGTRLNPLYVAKKSQQLFKKTKDALGVDTGSPKIFGPTALGSNLSRYQVLQSFANGAWNSRGAFDQTSALHLKVIYDFADPLNPKPEAVYRIGGKNTIDR